MRSAALLLVSFVALTACDRFRHARYEKSPFGAPATAASSGAAGSDRAIQGCQSPPVSSLSSGRAAGMACTTASDCAPVCCTCSASAWLASSCVGGVCATSTTTCARTSACAPVGGGVIVVGGGTAGGSGGSSSGTGSSGGGGAGGCGLTFDDSSCDSCMQKSCCSAVSACAKDGVCSGVNDCLDACGDDDTCVAACDDAYNSNAASAQLDSCLASSCASACR